MEDVVLPGSCFPRPFSINHDSLPTSPLHCTSPIHITPKLSVLFIHRITTTPARPDIPVQHRSDRARPQTAPPMCHSGLGC